MAQPILMKPIEIASKEIGNAGVKAQKYNDWFYAKPGIKAAWCGTFVSWCFTQAGTPLGTLDYTRGYAGVPFAVAHYQKVNKMTTKPTANDLCFFNWNGDMTKPEHTGIFEKDNGDGQTFTSIEGNTSGPNGDQSNGGVVCRKIRYYKTAIFAHPF